MKNAKEITQNELKTLSAILDQDMYGLQIVKTIEESKSKLSLGTLYNVLRRLEKKGLVESYWSEETDERGGNRRRYYKITGSGKEAVKDAQIGFSKLWNWYDRLNLGDSLTLT